MQGTLAVDCARRGVGTLRVMMRYANEGDEYARMIQLRGLAWGGIMTTSVIFLIGFPQLFHVVD